MANDAKRFVLDAGADWRASWSSVKTGSRRLRTDRECRNGKKMQCHGSWLILFVLVTDRQYFSGRTVVGAVRGACFDMFFLAGDAAGF